jgi:serine/threonine-protein kinase
MAVVHRANFHAMGGFVRPVVIKRILPELATEAHFIKMFVEEARLSALLDHPNIVQIHDFGVLDSQYFIAMEYIEGIPLHRFIRYYSRARCVPPEAAAFIIQQVCVGLHYAHSLTKDGQPLGLVHRDVSPANIMISSHGAVKLLDFGIAKAVDVIDREETRTGTLKGKWSYMAPEQVVGEPITARSDIFAAGIVFWELCTGRRLFKAKTDYLTLSNVVQAKAPPVTTFRPELPKLFDTVCGRALARRPDGRFRDAEEMADLLEGFLAQNPFTSSKLATMVAEVLAQSDPAAAAKEAEEVEKTQPSASESSSAVGFQIIESSGSRSSSASMGSLAAGEQSPITIPRRSWVLPATIAGLLVVTLVLLAVYLMLPSKPAQVVAAGSGGGGSGEAGGAAGSAAGSGRSTGIALGRPDARVAAAAAPDAARARKRIKLRAISIPPGATVTIAGESAPRGVTPLDLELEREAKARIRVALAGYLPVERDLQAFAGEELRFQLRPVQAPVVKDTKPAAVKDPKPLPKAGKEPKPATKAKKDGKQVPNLKGGDLADPYQ